MTIRSVTSILRFAVLAASVLGAAGSAHAQSYPTKPVRMFVPYPPGGTLDIVARMLAQKLTDQLGQNVVVENRAGGNGMIGSDAVAKAAADGYIILFNASVLTTTPMTVKSAPYNVTNDFTPIALVAKAPLAVSVEKALPVKDLKGLLDYGRANPGKLSFAIGSTASAGHLSTEALKRQGGMDYVVVPYKGSGLAYQDVIGGRISGFVDPLLGAVQYHRGGQLRILAVTSAQRVPNLPDVPTVAETIAGFEFYSWYGVWGPAKLPNDITQRLNAEINKAVASDMRDKLISQGLLVGGGSQEDFIKFQREDMARSQRIITDANIRAE